MNVHVDDPGPGVRLKQGHDRPHGRERHRTPIEAAVPVHGAATALDKPRDIILTDADAT